MGSASASSSVFSAAFPASSVHGGLNTSSDSSAGSSLFSSSTTKEVAKTLGKCLLRAAAFAVVYAVSVPVVFLSFYWRYLLYLGALAVRSEGLTMVGFMKKHPILSAWVGKTTVKHVIEAVNDDRRGFELYYFFKSLSTDLFVLPYQIAKNAAAFGVEFNCHDVTLRRPERAGSVGADVALCKNVEAVLQAWLERMPGHQLPQPHEFLKAWSNKLSADEPDFDPDAIDGSFSQLTAALVKLDGLCRTEGQDKPYHEGSTSFYTERLQPVLHQMYKADKALLLDIAGIGAASLGDCHDHAAFFFMRMETRLAVTTARHSLQELAPAVRIGNLELLQQANTLVQTILTDLLHEYHFHVLQEVGAPIVKNLEKSLRQFGGLGQSTKLDDLEEWMVMYQVLAAAVNHGSLVNVEEKLSQAYRQTLDPDFINKVKPASPPNVPERLNFDKLKNTLLASQKGENISKNAIFLLQVLPHQKYPYTTFLLKPKLLDLAREQYQSAEKKEELIEPSFVNVVTLFLHNWLKASAYENMVDCLAQHPDWQAALGVLMPITEPGLVVDTSQFPLLVSYENLMGVFSTCKPDLDPDLVSEAVAQNFVNSYEVLEWLTTKIDNNELNDGQYTKLLNALQEDVNAAEQAQKAQDAEKFKELTQQYLEKHPSLTELKALRSELAENPQPKDPAGPSTSQAATSNAA